MKKLLSLFGCFLFGVNFVYAQSATILPNQSDFINNSTANGAYAVKGVISSKDASLNSMAIRGINNSTNNGGVGIWGSHDGGGAGVFGSSVSGRGITGFSTDGIGVYGISTKLNAGLFEITELENISQV